MRKFTFFLFLFFPLFCFAQNRDVKTIAARQNTYYQKQITPARQNAALSQPRPAITPVTNNISYQKPLSQRDSFQKEQNNKIIAPKPIINQDQREQKPAVYKDEAFKKIPLNKAEKPFKEKPRPTPRPGNYSVIYWTDFIDTPTPREQEWASKVLDTQNLTLDGRGVQVAILDSGIKPHKKFTGADIEILDITGQNDPFDFCGHGTAVAGIIVGQKGRNFKGIAPAASLKSYKIADESGTTNNTYIINALDSILEYNRQNPNAKINIVNISYGLEEDNFELRNKLAEVYSSGITIISASGNDGKQGLLFPARYNFVFAVGSMNKDKTVSDFSNWGEDLDFILPGSGLKTLGLNDDYVWVRGTSFSSAYLTGIAALATQAFKDKYGSLPTPQELYEVLQKISTPVKTIAAIKQGYGVPEASKIVSYI